LWRHLEDAVREGSHRWEQEFGFTEGIFNHLFATEKDKLTFLAGMNGHGLLSSPAAVAAFELGRFCQMVDLGGATGHLALLPGATPVRATVFDLPTVTPTTRSYVEQAGLQERIGIQSGDFFTDPLPGADLYSVGRILHDWSEDKVRFLLGKICEHLPSGGGLLICERLLNEERDGPVSTYLQSLNMLLCTEGKERSPSEYESLTRAAGFSSFEFRRQDSRWMRCWLSGTPGSAASPPSEQKPPTSAHGAGGTRSQVPFLPIQPSDDDAHRRTPNDRIRSVVTSAEGVAALPIDDTSEWS
jgi:acetylserotonin N-methyltransferase